MLDPSSPYWLASALGLNAAGNTGSNLTSLPPLVINSMDYFTNPDYLKPKEEKDNVSDQLPTEQQPTTGVQEACFQPVSEKMLDSSVPSVSVVQLTCELKESVDVQNQKTTRFRIVKWQLDILESQFAVTKLLTKATQQRLQNQLNISAAQIRTWFKHRRQREKQVSDSNELLAKSHLNQLPLNTVSSNQCYSQMMLNNQHLQSSSVSSPHCYSSSTSSHQSSLSPQSNIGSQTQKQKNTNGTQLETFNEHDENAV